MVDEELSLDLSALEPALLSLPDYSPGLFKVVDLIATGQRGWQQVYGSVVSSPFVLAAVGMDLEKVSHFVGLLDAFSRLPSLRRNEEEMRKSVKRADALAFEIKGYEFWAALHLLHIKSPKHHSVPGCFQKSRGQEDEFLSSGRTSQHEEFLQEAICFLPWREVEIEMERIACVRAQKRTIFECSLDRQQSKSFDAALSIYRNCEDTKPHGRNLQKNALEELQHIVMLPAGLVRAPLPYCILPLYCDLCTGARGHSFFRRFCELFYLESFGVSFLREFMEGQKVEPFWREDMRLEKKMKETAERLRAEVNEHYREKKRLYGEVEGLSLQDFETSLGMAGRRTKRSG